MSTPATWSRNALINRGAISTPQGVNVTGNFGRPSKPVLIMSLLLLWTGAANASPIIFSNGVITPTNFPLSGNSNQFVGSQFLADDFAFAQPEILTDVHWTGQYYDANGAVTLAGTDAFAIEICTGFPPAVCTPLTLGPVNRTLNSGGYYDYSVDVLGLPIDTATHSIIISNSPTAPLPLADWGWGSTLTGNAFVMLNQPGPGAWNPSSQNMDFSLTGIPEPASLALLGLGLAGLGFSRRKR